MRFDAPHPWGAPCRRPTDVPIRSRRIGVEAYQGWTERRLTQEEAAQLLGVCARTFRRYIDRDEDAGLEREALPCLARYDAQGLLIQDDKSSGQTICTATAAPRVAPMDGRNELPTAA